MVQAGLEHCILSQQCDSGGEGLVTMPGELSSVPVALMVEGENRLPPCPAVDVCAVCVCVVHTAVQVHAGGGQSRP